MLSTIHAADEQSLTAMKEEMSVRKTREVILLFSLGSQTDGLIHQEVAKLGVFCLLANPRTMTANDVLKVAPIGIIVSGGPYSVYSQAEPVPFDRKIFELRIPVLGICLGFQMWAHHFGATVRPAAKKEFGGHIIRVTDRAAPLFAGIPENFTGWQSHSDEILDDRLIHVTARSHNGLVAAGEADFLHGVQFHPEKSDTEHGAKMLANFCFEVCGAVDRFPVRDTAARKIAELRKSIGDSRVILALSGGSDSSVTAFLLRRALEGDVSRVLAVYIKGLDRPDDESDVKRHFGAEGWFPLRIVDAAGLFLETLCGKESMAEKRAAMKAVYTTVLEDEIKSFGASHIVQGTLFTDLSESGVGVSGGARKAKIKDHHNTGNHFSVSELTPLSDLVKDNARNVGREIGVPEELLWRHPFPGPGLAVRIEGEVTREKLAIARAVDGIWIDEIRRLGAYREVWQAGAVLTSSVVTCSRGDEAASGYAVSLFAVTSVNGFSARPFPFEVAFLEKVAVRITGEVPAVGVVLYRVTPKPPATIEWG